MRTLVFDTETVPDVSLVNELTLGEVTKYASRREQELSEFMATCPPLLKVIAIGVKIDDGPPVSRVVGRDVDSEEELIERFFGILNKPTRFVTFNGRGFDFPVLLARAMAHSIRVPSVFKEAMQEYRYKPDKHYDMMDILTGFGAGSRYGLSLYTLAFGFGNPKDIINNGFLVQEAFVRKEYDKVGLYVESDVEVTWQLYQRYLEVME